MDIHKNARLTLRSREQTGSVCALRPDPLSAAARRFLVTRKTANKWVSPVSHSGHQGGLGDASSRTAPQSTRPRPAETGSKPRHRTAPATYPRLPDRTRHRAQPPPPSAASCARAHLKPLARSASCSARGPGTKHPLPRRSAASRYQGPYPLSGGLNARATVARRGLREHPGFEALHIAIDDHSPPRLYPDYFPRSKGGNHHRLPARRTRLFISATASGFALCSPTTEALTVRTSFRSACSKTGNQNTNAPAPYTPRTNGKAERFIQTPAARVGAYAKHWKRLR